MACRRREIRSRTRAILPDELSHPDLPVNRAVFHPPFRGPMGRLRIPVESVVGEQGSHRPSSISLAYVLCAISVRRLFASTCIEYLQRTRRDSTVALLYAELNV